MRGLRNADPLGFEVIGSPQHKRHGLWQCTGIRLMTGQQLFCLSIALGLCKAGGQSEWVKPVKIPPGR